MYILCIKKLPDAVEVFLRLDKTCHLKITFPTTGIFLVVALVLFFLGFQISEIPRNIQANRSAKELIGSDL